MPEMTQRQRAAWPEAIAEAQRHVGDTISTDPESYYWRITYEAETRPGRGHLLDATWTDGEHLVQIRMDVYGYPTVAVAETTWLHNSANEECDCRPCRAALGEG